MASVAGAGYLLAGAPVSGSFSSALVGSGNLALIVGLSGGVLVTLQGQSAALSLTMALSGSGNIALSGAGNLSLIVPFAAAPGSRVLTFASAADLKGLCSMAGVLARSPSSRRKTSPARSGRR